MSQTVMTLAIEGPYFYGSKETRSKDWDIYAKEVNRIKDVLDRYGVKPRGIENITDEEEWFRAYGRAEILVSGEVAIHLLANRIKFNVVDSQVLVPTNNLLASVEKARAEALTESPSQLFNSKIEVHMPGNALATYNETLLLEDACTDKLQGALREGWRMIAVCPQPSQRRPDYVLGRYNPNEVPEMAERRSTPVPVPVKVGDIDEPPYEPNRPLTAIDFAPDEPPELDPLPVFEPDLPPIPAPPTSYIDEEALASLASAIVEEAPTLADEPAFSPYIEEDEFDRHGDAGAPAPKGVPGGYADGDSYRVSEPAPAPPPAPTDLKDVLF